MQPDEEAPLLFALPERPRWPSVRENVRGVLFAAALTLGVGAMLHFPLRVRDAIPATALANTRGTANPDTSEPVEELRAEITELRQLLLRLSEQQLGDRLAAVESRVEGLRPGTSPALPPTADPHWEVGEGRQSVWVADGEVMRLWVYDKSTGSDADIPKDLPPNITLLYPTYPPPPADCATNGNDCKTWKHNAQDLGRDVMPFSHMWRTKWLYAILFAGISILFMVFGNFYEVCSEWQALNDRAPSESGGCCNRQFKPSHELVVLHCPWGFARIMSYFRESDIFRQHTAYNPDELDVHSMNVYRLLALISPDLRRCAPKDQDRDNDVTLPNLMGYLVMLMVVACIFIMQMYVPWNMVTHSWHANHLVGMKQMSYFTEIGWWDLTLQGVPLIFLGSKHFVTVEKAVREELNQCMYLIRASLSKEIKYGWRAGLRPQSAPKDSEGWTCGEIVGAHWELFWVLCSFVANSWVAGVMTLYVVHSIATASQSGSFMDLVLKLVGTMGVMDYDDSLMKCLPLWSQWYLMHHPKGRKCAQHSGISADEVAEESGDESDREDPWELPSKYPPLSWKPDGEPPDAGQGDKDSKDSKTQLVWRKISVKQGMLLGFRFHNGKVVYVNTTRPKLQFFEEQATYEQFRAEARTACHADAFRNGWGVLGQFYYEEDGQTRKRGVAPGLKLGDSILFITTGQGDALPGGRRKHHNKPPRKLGDPSEDGEERILGWHVHGDNKDEIIGRALATLRGKQPQKLFTPRSKAGSSKKENYTWANPDFFVLVKPEKSRRGWEWRCAAVDSSVHAFFYIITRCLMVGSVVFITMVYYTDDKGNHLGV
eukprot:TRINITY_DN23744_c0_g1_i1.p1 TRINITY_DN23744_c0_g1~~TRINITY_DN23744_c0_g1_i1.p1  ORF type:complete len:827 (+),score=145.15 TRINITY_DN23744_c0_g1_i1:85-2565(+)